LVCHFEYFLVSLLSVAIRWSTSIACCEGPYQAIGILYLEKGLFRTIQYIVADGVAMGHLKKMLYIVRP
jgi:hypothetical protein